MDQEKSSESSMDSGLPMKIQGFFGYSTHGIDAKGRLLIPALYRDQLQPSFTVTLDPEDNAIDIYPDLTFYTIMQKLHSMNRKNVAAERHMFHLAKFSFPGCQFDSQGRVILPQALREYASIGMQEVAIIGAIDHLRIASIEVSKAEDEYYHRNKDEIREIVAELSMAQFAADRNGAE